MDSGESRRNPPITLSSLNLRRPPTPVQSTICGKVRSFRTIVSLEWVFVTFAFLALITCFGLTIERMRSHQLDTSDFTFAVLLLLTVVFCCYYVAHSVLTERGDELLVFVASCAIVLMYCVTNYITQEKTTLIKKIRLGIVCGFTPFLIGIGVYLSIRYFKSNNLISNTVGAMADLQRACQIFFFCSSLLEFDLQLQLSMLILVMGNEGNAMKLTQKIILGSGVFLTVVFVSLGFLGLRRESIPIMIVFYVLGFLEPAYVIYKFYTANKLEDDGDISEIYESTYACGCFALVVWLLLMGSTGYYSTHCFGKGLKEKLHGYPSRLVSKSSAEDTESQSEHNQPP